MPTIEYVPLGEHEQRLRSWDKTTFGIAALFLIGTLLILFSFQALPIGPSSIFETKPQGSGVQESSGDGSGAEAYATLVLSESYVLPATVLGWSLRLANATRPLIALYNNITDSSVASLRRVGWEMRKIDVVPWPEEKELKMPRLEFTFTKLRLWQATDFAKLVYLDADCLALRNIDALFGMSELAAGEYHHWTSEFNSGLMVLRPSAATYERMMRSAALDDYDTRFGEQGFLNFFFKDRWAYLSDSYNLRHYHQVTDDPALVLSHVHVLHYAGTDKPWVDWDFSTFDAKRKKKILYMQRWRTVYEDYMESIGEEVVWEGTSQFFEG